MTSEAKNRLTIDHKLWSSSKNTFLQQKLTNNRTLNERQGNLDLVVFYLFIKLFKICFAHIAIFLESLRLILTTQRENNEQKV